MIKEEIIVSGRVQGVGFRYSTLMLAQQLGIKGEVWNNADGTVGIFAQAETSAQMTQFIAALRKGVSPFSKVAYLDQTPAAFPDFQDFKVKY